MKSGAIVETIERDNRSGYQFQDGWQAADSSLPTQRLQVRSP
jgi:hypothetical protein